MDEQNNKEGDEVQPVNLDEGQVEEAEISMRTGWREVFRQAFDKARREQPMSQRELGRDRSRSLFLLAEAGIAVLLLFLDVFSSSNAKETAGARPSGTPDLGRRLPPGQKRSGQTGSVTPLLNAQTGPSDMAPGQGVTPEEMGRTARPSQPPVPSSPASVTNRSAAGLYALGRIGFSDTAQREEGPAALKTAAEQTSDDGVCTERSRQSSEFKPKPVLAAVEQTPMMLKLPAGTRLMARLKAVVSSAVKTPVVAAI